MSRSVFRCIAGCAGDYPLDEVIYKCPKCGDLLEVVHDIEALKARSAASWIKLFDERYLRTTGRTARACGARRSGCSRTSRDENVVSMFEGGTNLLWAERYGRAIGLADLWVKQCGVSHTGSFKDLGMTVLVSTVKQMIAEGKPIRAVACASTGDTSAALAAYGAAAGIRTHGHPAARQGLDRAAGAAAGQRRARAGDRRRLRRLHGDGQAAGRGGGRLPGQQHEQPAHRGAEDGRHRDGPAVRLGACPTGSSSRAATSATSARWAPASR